MQKQTTNHSKRKKRNRKEIKKMCLLWKKYFTIQDEQNKEDSVNVK